MHLYKDVSLCTWKAPDTQGKLKNSVFPSKEMKIEPILLKMHFHLSFLQVPLHATVFM